MSDLNLEDILILEGFDYKETMGSKGAQLHIKECAKCGKDSWKVYANQDSSLGNCFSCGENFNLWIWVRWILERRGGVGIKSHDIGKYLNDARRKLGYRPRERKVQAKPITVTPGSFELPFSQPLPYSDGWVPPYLLERGIDGHYAKMFDLRFSSFGSWAYKDDQGEEHVSSFANRILIPVYDLDGKLVTFQGRDTTGTSKSKYKFAGGLPGTARYLYNGHVAKQRKARRVVMGEGAFDVIGIQKAIDQAPEFSDTVPIGSWGKHLSKAKEGADQVGAFTELKRSGLEEAINLYDGEPEAYEEAVKAAELQSKIGLKASVAVMPAGQDPGGADARTILQALTTATEYTRTSALRMRMRNPYRLPA